MGKIAIEEGYTNWTCVDWSNWCKRNEVSAIIEQDALSYLQAQADNSFDYVISRALLECVNPPDLVTLITECNRVALTKQIHTTYRIIKGQYYIVKTFLEWKTIFLNDPDIIIEDYRKDG